MSLSKIAGTDLRGISGDSISPDWVHAPGFCVLIRHTPRLVDSRTGSPRANVRREQDILFLNSGECSLDSETVLAFLQGWLKKR